MTARFADDAAVDRRRRLHRRRASRACEFSDLSRIVAASVEQGVSAERAAASAAR